MSSFVFDASFLVRALSDPFSQAHIRFVSIFKQKSDVLSLPLLTFEVANALRFSQTDPNLARAIFVEFLRLPIKNIDLSSQQKKRVLDLAYKTKTTVYDTAYHVLAKFSGATLLTCDADYYRKAKEIGNIELLS